MDRADCCDRDCKLSRKKRCACPKPLEGEFRLCPPPDAPPPHHRGSACPRRGDGDPGPPPPLPRDPPRSRRPAVTLITGDVVESTDAGGGKKAATVQPAPGRERRHVPHHRGRRRAAGPAQRRRPVHLDRRARRRPVRRRRADRRRLRRRGRDDAPADRPVRRPAPRRPVARRYDDHPQLAVDRRRGGARRPRTSCPSSGSRSKPGARRPHAEQRHRQDLARRQGPAGARQERAADRRPGRLAGRVRGHRRHRSPCWTPASTPTHPDLAGKVKEAADFSGSPTGAEDHFGHGTHVAATIAGTGAGAGGTRKGVAPRPTCWSARCSATTATATTRWIIAGMEWAAAEGAKVVNMSLGGDPTDGTDPLSQAVNELTAADRHAVRGRRRQRGPGRVRSARRAPPPPR